MIFWQRLRVILLDTSFLIAYKNNSDVHHELAAEIMKDISHGKYGLAFISDYVIDESISVLLGKMKNFELALSFSKELISSFEVLFMNQRYFESAWKIFSEQSGKSLSLTDCSLIVLMREKNILHLATFDKGFLGVEGINVIGARER